MMGVLLALLMLASACSQSRQGIGNRGSTDEIWEPLSLCVNKAPDVALGCFEVQLNITQNLAYVYVGKLGFDAGKYPYRVLARPTGDASFHLLRDGITTSVGGEFEAPAKSGHYIEDYEEWMVEAPVARSPSGAGFIPAGAGAGIKVVDAILNWPELDQNSNDN